MSEHKEPIPSMIYNAAVGGHVTNSQQIIDENENKEQSQINAEVKQTLGQGGSVDSRISAAVNIEKTRAEAAEQLLQEQYNALTQSDIIVGDLPTSGTKNLIYRVPGTNSYYDYMWNGTQFVKMAEYDNSIDNEPTAGSDNLVKSGGVISKMTGDSSFEHLCNELKILHYKGKSNANLITSDFKAKDKVIIRIKNLSNSSGYFTVKYSYNDSDTETELFTQLLNGGEEYVSNEYTIYNGTSYTFKIINTNNVLLYECFVADNRYNYSNIFNAISSISEGLEESPTKSIIIPANQSRWFDVTSFFKGKKVLIKSSVNVNGSFPFYSSGTTLGMGLYNIWVFYDFSDFVEDIKLYPSGNTESVIIEYIDSKSVVENFENSKILNVSKSIVVGNYFLMSTNTLAFKPYSDTNFEVFPNRDSYLKCGQKIDDTFILNVEGHLYRFESTLNKYVKYADEISVNNAIDEIKQRIKYNVEITETNQTVAVDIPQGAYILKGTFSNNCYATIKCLDSDEEMLSNDKSGNDDNEKSTVPNNLYNAGNSLTKELYFNKSCMSVVVVNPNGANISLEFFKIDGCKEYDLVVASDGSGQLSSLWDAIKWVGDTTSVHKTIFVKPGRYEMPTQNYNTNFYRNNRNISIIGADKNACVVFNNDGYYRPTVRDNAPLQLSGNVTIKNLTVISSDSEPSDGNKSGAYCMHVDSSASVGDNVLIENCIFKNDHGCCVGAGLRAGLTITIKDCDFYSEIDENYESWHGVVAAHDENIENAGTEPQKIVFINNVLKSTRKAFSFTGNYRPLDITFIGNAIFKGTDEALITLDGFAVINSETCLNNVSF